MRRTAITCPIHQGCVLVFLSLPEGELGDTKPLKLPEPYYSWAAKLGDVVVGLEHNPASERADLLLAETLSPMRRLDRLEDFVTRRRGWRKAWEKRHG